MKKLTFLFVLCALFGTQAVMAHCGTCAPQVPTCGCQKPQIQPVKPEPVVVREVVEYIEEQPSNRPPCELLDECANIRQEVNDLNYQVDTLKYENRRLKRHAAQNQRPVYNPAPAPVYHRGLW